MKNVRKTVNRMSFGIIIYNLIMFLTVIMDGMVKACIAMAQNKAVVDSEQLLNQTLDQISQEGTSSIIGVILGIIFLILYNRKADWKKQLVKTHKPITMVSFWQLFCIFMSAQAIFTIVAGAAENGLNILGYTIMGDVESATGVSTTLSMFLYSGIIGPVAEEFVYRGFVMRSLEKYGKSFAIILSAIMFAVMHGNFLQGMFAFFVGCILGYVAMEYSIKYSIAMHILNNMIFGDLFGMAIQGLPEQIQTILANGCMIFFFCAGMVALYQNREKVMTYKATKKIPVKILVNSLTTIWTLIFIALEIVVAFGGIQKL